MASVDLATLDEAKLAEWLLGRRWFGSKARDVAQSHVLDVVALYAGPPALHAALVEARFPGGTHDVYQLLLAMRDGARRVEAGVNPELEMLRFLSGHDYAHVAELGGWYQYEGELMDATFGVVQRYVPGAWDGWELALDDLGADPERFVARLRELGSVIGRMHSVLASDASDPAFAPEEPSDESLSLLTATIDEEIERVFLEMPEIDAIEAIAGRGAEVRDRLQLLSHVGARGKLIRHHGDLHLGQTMLAADGWVILDFEGEPARPLIERRRKRSPLRDVAGMLRSFAYAASASELQRGRRAPDGWEERAREAFLSGYFETVDPVLMPPGEAPTRTLLSIFELEKAVYELRYELNNRPDWVGIPVAGIARLLEEPL